MDMSNKSIAEQINTTKYKIYNDLVKEKTRKICKWSRKQNMRYLI